GVEVGSGFSDTYGFGAAVRIGYAFRDGLYLGGRADYFVGQSLDNNTAHAAFVGGEAGYKFFATRRWEIRPYAFAGPAFITTVDRGVL
ncbi:hypothetical protein, partial [Enterococcus faecalis]|uniref:hypothetical protein n=1 Tax=Enterococcus faecalis TaxID=1351 RepID=UPI00403F58C9